MVAANGLTHSLALVGVGQAGVDALPERLGERDALGKWKRHRLGGELISRHGEKATIQTDRELILDDPQLT